MSEFKDAKFVITKDNNIHVWNNETNKWDQYENVPRIIGFTSQDREHLMTHVEGEDSELVDVWSKVLAYMREIDQRLMLKVIQGITSDKQDIPLPTELLSMFIMATKILGTKPGFEGSEQDQDTSRSEIDDAINDLLESGKGGNS